MPAVETTGGGRIRVVGDEGVELGGLPGRYEESGRGDAPAAIWQVLLVELAVVRIERSLKRADRVEGLDQLVAVLPGAGCTHEARNCEGPNWALALSGVGRGWLMSARRGSPHPSAREQRLQTGRA